MVDEAMMDEARRQAEILFGQVKNARDGLVAWCNEWWENGGPPGWRHRKEMAVEYIVNEIEAVQPEFGMGSGEREAVRLRLMVSSMLHSMENKSGPDSELVRKGRCARKQVSESAEDAHRVMADFFDEARRPQPGLDLLLKGIIAICAAAQYAESKPWGVK